METDEQREQRIWSKLEDQMADAMQADGDGWSGCIHLFYDQNGELNVQPIALGDTPKR